LEKLPGFPAQGILVVGLIVRHREAIDVLTKDQAAVVADQLVADAKSRADRRVLARLEARGGSMPQGITLDRFKDLVAKGESRLIRTRQFQGALAVLAGLLLADAYFRAAPLVVGTIPAGLLLMRLLARKLVARFVREHMHDDA
jgi:hypothetical protein